MIKIREGYVHAIAACLALPIATLFPKGMAPLLAGTAAVIVLVRWIRGDGFPRSPVRLSVAVAAFVLYSLLTVLWSRTPPASGVAILPLAGNMICGLIVMASMIRLDDADRTIAAKGALIGIGIGLLILTSEMLDRGLLYRSLKIATGREAPSPNDVAWRFNQGMTVAALLLWPWAMAALRHHSLRAGLFALTVGGAVVAILAEAAAPVAGIAVGGATALMVWAAPRAMPALFAAVLAIGVLAAPMLPRLLPDPTTESDGLAYLSPSSVHRLFIWRATVDLIEKRPLLGHGFDTARSFYGADSRTTTLLRKFRGGSNLNILFEPIPLHPHNMVLQVWLELGAVGALFFLGVLLSVILAIVRSPLDRVGKAACFGFFATALLIAAVSFGAWQAWWLSTLWLCGAFAAGAAFTPKPSPHPIPPIS